MNLAETRSHIPLVHQRAVKSKKRPIPKVSKKMAGLKRQYMKLREIFLLNHPYCEHWLAENGFKFEDVFERAGSGPVCVRIEGSRMVEYHVPRSTEIHHRKGRGRFYLDTSTWMAVRPGHDIYIHLDPKRYEKGYCLLRR